MIKKLFQEDIKNKELAYGQKIETEHLPTYKMLCHYVSQYGELPPPEFLYGSISLDHINESLKKKNPLYYSLLELMEKLMMLGITREMIIDKFELKGKI